MRRPDSRTFPAVRTALLAAALLAAAGGCAPGDEGRGGDADSTPGGWTTAIDSLPGGGLRVVHTPPDDAAPTWTLEPELRIGALDGTGPDVFGDIRDLEVTPDGRIVVLDGQAQEVRVFGPDGAHLRTFGGKGGGPGEFEGANGVVVDGDGRIRVPDYRNSRVSFLDADSGFVGSHPYQPMMFSIPWGGRVDADGRSWSRHYRRSESPGESRIVWVGLDTTGAPIDSLVPFEEEPLDHPGAGGWVVPMGERRLTMSVPNYPFGEDALDPALRLWTTREGDPSYRLVRWTADGDTALILEVRRPPVPTDRTRVDSMVSDWEQRVGATVDRSKIPDTAPAIHAFFFDDDGRLWVRPATPPGDDRFLLDAFDAQTGAYLGTLSTELGLQTVPPPVVRGDTVWGVVRDELDVPGVVRGRVEEVGRGLFFLTMGMATLLRESQRRFISPLAFSRPSFSAGSSQRWGVLWVSPLRTTGFPQTSQREASSRGTACESVRLAGHRAAKGNRTTSVSCRGQRSDKDNL